MAISPQHLPIDSIAEQRTTARHLLTVQVAMINQITQATSGTLVLDDVLHAIALQLADILQASGCLIVKADEYQQRGISSKSVANLPKNGADVLAERLHSTCCEFYQYYHSRLAPGKRAMLRWTRLANAPGIEQQLPQSLQDLAAECGISTLSIVPILHRHSCIGGITLYQRHEQQEWTPQEIAFLEAIAAQCAIALTLAELEERNQTELKQRQAIESALQELEVRNRSLLEAIPDLIVRISRHGIYLSCTAAKDDALLIPATERIGKHLHQVLPTEVAGLIWHHVELTLETDEIQIVEYQLWSKGKSRNFEARIVKSGSDEATAIVQDITERVQPRLALAQVNDALEIRVAERTAALREANHALSAEIIERKRTQEQLKESEERFRNLVETSSDWVWEVDENAVYTYASPKVRTLLGYEPSEILGKTPFDFMPPEESRLVADIFAALATSQQPFTCLENTNIHKNGHPVILERSGVPVFDAKGTFRGYRGIDRDITERKRAEKEVRFLHSITQALFESQDLHAALGVALQKVCEATGWDFGEAWVPRADGNVLECSPAWFSKSKLLEPFRSASETLTFAPGNGLPGRVWISQQPEWRRDVSTESNEVYLRARIAKEVGLKAGLGIPLLTPNGILAVLVFYMFESRDEDQRLIELISASTELGLMIQRKQAEGEIRKALVREKELTELKSRFISMTSHEFRTPLTTIQSSAELLERYSYKWSEEKKSTHLHRIQTAVKHITGLLNDVLIIGKAEAGKLEFNPVPLDLEKFCRDLVVELQLNDNKQHAITFEIETGDWRVGSGEGGDEEIEKRERGDVSIKLTASSSIPTHSLGERSGAHSPRAILCMDEKLLRQILENLLSNAIKYSPADSIVSFTLSYFSNRAVFQIRDRGIGIPTDDRERLFETFHRAANVGTIAGTGLGLAIVKKCVDVHQGQIAVESEVGVGTTFTVTLPTYKSLVP